MIKLRRLVKEVTITKKKRWDVEFHTGKEEVIQMWDDKLGWVDLPVEYEFTFVKED